MITFINQPNYIDINQYNYINISLLIDNIIDTINHFINYIPLIKYHYYLSIILSIIILIDLIINSISITNHSVIKIVIFIDPIIVMMYIIDHY